jgi:hypothetical protein
LMPRQPESPPVTCDAPHSGFTKTKDFARFPDPYF